MIPHDWQLKVEFGYEYDDPEMHEETPEKEAETFYHFVLADWGVDAEDIEQDELVLDGATVTVRADVLDYLSRLIYFATMHTIPKSVTLTRMDYDA